MSWIICDVYQNVIDSNINPGVLKNYRGLNLAWPKYHKTNISKINV